MKNYFAPVRASLRSSQLIVVLLTGAASGLPAQPAPAEASATNPALTAEQMAALKSLDADLARLDLLFEKITDARVRDLTKGFIDVFKTTRAALGKNFDQVKHDELKFEVVAEFQRIALWLTPPRETPLQFGVESNPSIIFDLDPSPASAAEVKAALAALDGEIKRLEEQSARLPAGAAQDAAAQRLKSIQATRAALGRKFTKAGWTAMLSELKGAIKNRG